MNTTSGLLEGTTSLVAPASYLIPSPENTIWRPLPGSQTKVLRHQHIFELLYHGTRGPGKSDTLLMDYVQHVGKGFGPAWRGIIFRQTYKQLEDLITKSKRWYYQIWPGCSFNASNHTWTFPDGAQLLLRQYNRDDDYLNYHGHEFPFVGWDELTNWANLDGYKRMMSVCRSSTPGMPRNVRATTNPYGPGHTAVKFHFRLPEKDGIIRERPFVIENPLTGEVTTETLTRLAVKGTIFENTIRGPLSKCSFATTTRCPSNPSSTAAKFFGP